MINLLIQLFLIVCLVVGAFYITQRLVMLWTGKSKQESTAIIRNFVCSNREDYQISNDNNLIERMWAKIHEIIGDKAFEDLLELSHNYQLFFCGSESGLHCLKFTVIVENEDTKKRLEIALKTLLSNWLAVHGMCACVLVDWETHEKLFLPMIVLRYAETAEEPTMKRWIALDTKSRLKKYTPIIDEDFENESDEISDRV